jgi:hypothetical protein
MKDLSSKPINQKLINQYAIEHENMLVLNHSMVPLPFAPSVLICVLNTGLQNVHMGS